MPCWNRFFLFPLHQHNDYYNFLLFKGLIEFHIHCINGTVERVHIVPDLEDPLQILCIRSGDVLNWCVTSIVLFPLLLRHSRLFYNMTHWYVSWVFWMRNYIHLKTSISRLLLLACKSILLKWLSPLPPTFEDWCMQVNTTLLKESQILSQRGTPLKFHKLLDPWLQIPGLTPLALVSLHILQCWYYWYCFMC